jgi:hypothetical protein
MRRAFIVPVMATFLLQGCVTVPVSVSADVVAGRELGAEDLDFLQRGITTKDEVIRELGSPFLWLQKQRMAVYGLVRTETVGLLLVGMAGSPTTWRSFEREASFVALNDSDTVIAWGEQGPLARDDSWLSAALDWADSR